ncbi:hypothetical protein ACFRFH_03940 [Leifsonia sp. NPDC056824]
MEAKILELQAFEAEQESGPMDQVAWSTSSLSHCNSFTSSWESRTYC